ncbi:MAG: cytochrome c, partial [Myxococcota bacterium]|nr:cytochrome c [Myxococcota bacterium]
GECSDLSKGEEDYFQDSILNPVLDEHCVVCHSVDLPNGTGLGTRRGAPRFANYNTFSSDTGATRRPNVTWARIADRTMPPMGRQLRPDETDLLYEWLNCVQAVQSQAQGDDDDSAR